MKSNKVITVLIVVAVMMALLLLGVIGVIVYHNTHVFVEGVAYSKDSRSLDLREEDISFNHYLLLKEQLPECSILWNVPFHGTKISSGATEISISDLSEGDVDILIKYLPELQKVDASACSNYAMLELLRKKAPDVTVIYTVDLGGKSFDPDVEQLVLEVGDYDYDVLLRNIPYLKKLKSIQLKAPEITREQIKFLRDAHKELKISCTVMFMDQECDMEAIHLDLSGLTSDKVEEAAKKFSLLPELETVELDNKDGVSQLSQKEVKQLMEAAPEVKFNYTFEFYGHKVNTSQEEIIVKDKSIGDDGEDNIRMALDLLQGCKRFVLDNCGVSSEVMAEIREDYRERTKVVWRVWFGEGTALTDAEILRSTYNLEDDNCGDLYYMEDVRFMDIGHNEWLNDCSFIAGMPNLEVAIVSGAPIRSLEPFEGCKKLRVLEMANCIYVPDLEPLRGLESLEMLNIGFTRMKSMEPINDLKLTHLTMVHSPIPSNVRAEYQENHPDCWVVYRGDQPYGQGWRYDENNDPLPWYAEIQGVFRYPDSPNNVGWYLESSSDKK